MVLDWITFMPPDDKICFKACNVVLPTLSTLNLKIVRWSSQQSVLNVSSMPKSLPSLARALSSQLRQMLGLNSYVPKLMCAFMW